MVTRYKPHASEDAEQEALFDWAALNESTYPQLAYMYHVPNGGKRDIHTALALKRRGVKPGVPDIVLPVARGGYHGLYIELKVGTNKPTAKQVEFLSYLEEAGYCTALCYGWIDARETIEAYLTGRYARKEEE